MARIRSLLIITAALWASRSSRPEPELRSPGGSRPSREIRHRPVDHLDHGGGGGDLERVRVDRDSGIEPRSGLLDLVRASKLLRGLRRPSPGTAGAPPSARPAVPPTGGVVPTFRRPSARTTRMRLGSVAWSAIPQPEVGPQDVRHRKHRLARRSRRTASGSTAPARSLCPPARKPRLAGAPHAECVPIADRLQGRDRARGGRARGPDLSGGLSRVTSCGHQDGVGVLTVGDHRRLLAPAAKPSPSATSTRATAACGRRHRCPLLRRRRRKQCLAPDHLGSAGTRRISGTVSACRTSARDLDLVHRVDHCRGRTGARECQRRPRATSPSARTRSRRVRTGTIRGEQSRRSRSASIDSLGKRPSRST